MEKPNNNNKRSTRKGDVQWTEQSHSIGVRDVALKTLQGSTIIVLECSLLTRIFNINIKMKKKISSKYLYFYFYPRIMKQIFDTVSYLNDILRKLTYFLSSFVRTTFSSFMANICPIQFLKRQAMLCSKSK
jgi:hypothetical protein